MSGLLLFVLIAIFFPPLCALVLAIFLRIPQRDIPVFVAYGLGIGPALLAWLVDVLFRVTPGLPAAFYIAILSVFIASILILGLYGLFGDAGQPICEAFVRSCRSVVLQQGPIEWLILLFLAGLCVFVALYDLAVPLTWSDPTEYTVTAQILFRD